MKRVLICIGTRTIQSHVTLQRVKSIVLILFNKAVVLARGGIYVVDEMSMKSVTPAALGCIFMWKSEESKDVAESSLWVEEQWGGYCACLTCYNPYSYSKVPLCDKNTSSMRESYNESNRFFIRRYYNYASNKNVKLACLILELCLWNLNASKSFHGSDTRQVFSELKLDLA